MIRLFFPDAEVRKMALEKIGAIEGGNQSLARLAGYVNKTYQRENHEKNSFFCPCVAGWFCSFYR
jgi:hypothetical protein